MSRTLTGAVDAALAAANLRTLLLGELYFDGATEYVCNADRNFVWNGNTYLGAARVGRIDPIEEGSEIKMYGIALTLAGVVSAQIAEALTDYYQGRPCIIRMAILDDSYQIVADPVVVFRGRMDQMRVKLGKTATITLTVENRLADWDRPRVSRNNHEDQQRRHPSDRFYEYTAQTAAKTLPWGVR